MPPTRLLTPSSCCTDCCPERQKCGFTFSTVLIPRWRQKILSALAACDILTDDLMTASGGRTAPNSCGWVYEGLYVPAIGDVMRMVKILRLRGEHTDVAK
jgi:hypothetical protein